MLNETARQQVMNQAMQEREYIKYRQHFQSDMNSFFESITVMKEYRQKLLYLFVRFAVDAHEVFKLKGISDNVYFDTFSDIRIWCDVCYRDFGVYGIEEYNWLQEHLQLRLYRLGRLQFQLFNFEHDLKVGKVSVKKNQLVLNVHIPEGEPLSPELVDRSFRLARDFFREVSPIFTCRSWLLYPELSKIMNEHSNIMRFQRLFSIYEIDGNSKEAEQRIFHRVESNPYEYKEKTRLQRAAKSYLLAGGKLGSGNGIYMLDDTTS